MLLMRAVCTGFVMKASPHLHRSTIKTLDFEYELNC